MKIAEYVTFGGSNLDRAAECRGQATELALDPEARAIVLWRGKVLTKKDELVRVSLDHPVLDDASPDQVFLGRDESGPIFGADLSGWTPPDMDDAAFDSFLDATHQRHPAVADDAVFAELRTIMIALSLRDAELAATAKAVLGWHLSHKYCSRCGALSDFSMAGWQRNCTACGGHHFPRTDPVVIMLITHGNAVLLGRSPGWPDGMYSCLAGFVEPGETIEAAVRREVFEEAGVRVGAVTYLASQPWPFPASLMIGCAGDALGTDLTIDPDEIEDARWVSREELAQAFSGHHPDILPARKGAIAHFLLQNWLADTLD
ncbi:NAD(+) diphosphatase [Yoonia sediminilitoris]|uniref:NAD(+) diphosphatase n=1 Tax=Yoonia sediminilitoris TaxID=1286148 RepID=A0A2T6K7H0_9RHOB|nr:NAD(+) diphosphatase [Yoonia sediminilitoris]PUB10665.1 NAD+ diphosphatase [Yoonia sediminilitoris]RCW90417.1 NAD+ diphosphatase [Yoonia sediminilitoris]